MKAGLAIVGFGLSGAMAFVDVDALAQTPTYASIKYVRPGSRLDWCASTNEVAFDRLGADGKYDVYAGLAQANERCLTCADPRFAGHTGNPTWHPTGQYVVFQSHNVTLPFLPTERETISWMMTSPGWGTNNDLWLQLRDGSAAWPLRQVAAGEATLHPQFSRAGTRLIWSEKIGLDGANELWTIKLADLVWSGGQPQLANIVDIAPFGTRMLYEASGFTSGDARIVFAAGDPSHGELDIYTYELATGEVRNLTNSPGEWDEHARMSPDGTRIVWASSRDITITRDYFVPFLDYWTMDPDGSNRRRLTYFNDPAAPEYYDGGAVATDFAYSPDGTTMACRLELTKPDAGLPRDMLEAIALVKPK